MNPGQAADLAARTLAAIDAAAADLAGGLFRNVKTRCDDDRERVASDLAGLRDALEWHEIDDGIGHGEHAARYAANLSRTAALYGVPDA